MDEFYTRPVLCVRDFLASVAYYCEKLGFEKSWDFGGNPPIIAQVARNGLDVILDSGSAIPRASTPSVLSMSLHEPAKLGALYEELRARGAKDVSPPTEVGWQKSLFQLAAEDLDGNVLVFWGEGPE